MILGDGIDACAGFAWPRQGYFAAAAIDAEQPACRADVYVVRLILEDARNIIERRGGDTPKLAAVAFDAPESRTAGNPEIAAAVQQQVADDADSHILRCGGDGLASVAFRAEQIQAAAAADPEAA